MTVEDAFDARLRAAFAAAEPEANEEFVQRVTARVGALNRRLLIVGGAGAGGSTIASTQLEAFFRSVENSAAAPSWLGDNGPQLMAFMQPETLAAVTLAAMVAMLALVLPSRS